LKNINDSGVCQSKQQVRVVHVSPEESSAFQELAQLHKRVSNGSNALQNAITQLKSKREQTLKIINNKPFTEEYL
jgi:hypothetical protein